MPTPERGAIVRHRTTPPLTKEISVIEGITESAPIPESILDELVPRVLEAFNSHDPDAFVAVMTDDVIFDHSAWPTTLRGKDEVRRLYADYIWRAFPDLRLEREDGPFLHPHAPRVALAWRVTGTHDGPLDPPGFAATGKPIDLAVREIAEFRDGRASRLQIQVDMAGLMRQIGLLPGRNSRGERALAALQRLRMKVPVRR
jgi:steroid delta-isomerase-like uncharacterized protein